MHKKMVAVVIGFAAFAMSATAQTAVTTSENTSGTVPVFNGTVSASGVTTIDIKDSPISVSNGNVGIGTTNPGTLLQVGTPNVRGGGVSINATDVVGAALPLQISDDTSGLTFGANTLGRQIRLSRNGFAYYYDMGLDYNNQFFIMNQNSTTEGFVINPAGSVGIGTTNPSSLLTLSKDTGVAVNGSVGSAATTMSNVIAFKTYYSGYDIDTVKAAIGAGFDGITSWNTQNGLLSFSTANMGVLSERMRIMASGNVGIGTTNPGAKLEVSGNIKLTANSGSSITFPDGSVQTVAYTGVTCGADYAEAVDVTGDRTKYEPGDILVLDPNMPDKFLKSSQPYSTLVAGIYSTKPGFVGRKQLPTPETNATEVPMAMVGRVPTKVTTENGSVKIGDLLVSSSTVGYAMKGTDRSQMLGAVIGKAMGNLDTGSGVIEVLVTLQ